MKRTTLPALLLLNAALLLILGAVTFAPAASAQPRPRGEYIMVGGTVQGGLSAAAYIVDETNQELVAVMWDANAGDLVGLGYANLQEAAASLRQVRP